MKFPLPTAAVLGAVLGLVPLASAGGPGWHADLGPALEEAAEAGKDLLVDFTGSDWCGWCIRLDREVFSQPEFLDYARRHFVLVALDFPRKKSLPADLRRRNDAEAEAFAVEAFPTIMLLTSEGVAYAQTGYQPGGATRYAEHLEELRTSSKREQALEQMEALRSEDTERRLAGAYAMFGRVHAGLLPELLGIVRAHDGADSRGVLARAALQEFVSQHLATPTPDWVAADKALQTLLTDTPSADRMGAYHGYAGLVALEQGDEPRAREALERIRAIGDRRIADWLAQRIDDAAAVR